MPSLVNYVIQLVLFNAQHIYFVRYFNFFLPPLFFYFPQIIGIEFFTENFSLFSFVLCWAQVRCHVRETILQLSEVLHSIGLTEKLSDKKRKERLLEREK